MNGLGGCCSAVGEAGRPSPGGSKPTAAPLAPGTRAGRKPDPSDQDQTRQPLTQTQESGGASLRLALMALG